MGRAGRHAPEQRDERDTWLRRRLENRQSPSRRRLRPQPSSLLQRRVGHEHGDDALPGWYRTAGAASWRFLVIVAAVGAVAYALVYLRVVVLPIIVALLVSTLLLPVVRWLKGRGVPTRLPPPARCSVPCC